MFIKIKKEWVSGLLFFFSISFPILQSGDVFALEIKYPQLPGAIPPQEFIKTTPPEEIFPYYIKYFFNLTIWIAGFIAFGILVYAGFLYLTARGRPEKIISAKNYISGVFLGLLLLLSSHLLFQIVNPELTTLKLPPLEKTEPSPPPPQVSTPVLEKNETSIHTGLLFGRLIEGSIFETYISKIPQNEQERRTLETKQPRMTRIENNANTTLDISTKLLNNSRALKKATDSCSCGQSKPCCQNANPGPGCKNNACSTKLGCTCDPCASTRGQIESLQKDNTEKLIPALEKEQQKTLAEIKSLKTELNKLKRERDFLKSCPFYLEKSLKQFYDFKNYRLSQNALIREFNFFEDDNVLYLDRTKTENLTDWASFYCVVGGTILSGSEIEKNKKSQISAVDIETCFSEIPLGEIIDRTLRTGELLIKRMEKMVELEKELIKAVDKLQVLVSQCSSQRCLSFCRLVEIGDEKVCISKCINAPQFPEGPCPKTEIAKQLEIIEKIYEIKTQNQQSSQNQQTQQESKERKEGIKNVITNPKPQQKKDAKKTTTTTIKEKETIGILPIIQTIVPKILQDLKTDVRQNLRICELQTNSLLVGCQQAKEKVGPGGVIKLCCEEAPYYQFCLNECYLEEKNYKKCLKNCLYQKSLEAKKQNLEGADFIAACYDSLNFFCCTSPPAK